MKTLEELKQLNNINNELIKVLKKRKNMYLCATVLIFKVEIDKRLKQRKYYNG